MLPIYIKNVDKYIVKRKHKKNMHSLTQKKDKEMKDDSLFIDHRKEITRQALAKI